jgi:hypothetical protein
MPLVLDGTNGVSGVDGTASNPSYEGTDSNTGIFFPAADTVAIGTGGTERVRVVSAGDVGVGTSTPATISNRTVLSINNASNGGALNLLVNGTETLRLLTDNSSFGYVYNVANQPLVFGTNNTERMRLDASGKLLVGGTSAIGSPYIQSRTTNSTTISGSYAWNSTDQGISLINESSTTGTGVGITMLGGSSRNSIGAIYMVQETGNSLGALSFYTGGGGLSSPYAYERARITSTGELLVGAAGMGNIYGARLSVEGTSGGSTASEFRVLGSALSTAATYFIKADNNTTTSNVFCKFVINSGGAASGQINANGASAAAFGSWSDERLKENIVDLPPQLGNICALRPVEFDYIESEGGGHQIGFVAQQMEAIYPDVIGEREDGMKSITGWSKTEARLVKAIQEQQAMIDEMKAEIAALKGAA